MSAPCTQPCTAFAGRRLLISGSRADVAIAVARSAKVTEAALAFDDATGAVIDPDLRGCDAEILQRLAEPPRPSVGRDRPDAGATAGAAGGGQTTRGRRKFGVVTREMTLLPRQWEWLATQPGGASATLRRLVDDARKAVHPRQRRRAAQEAAYRLMQAIAGTLPGYEEVTRALFADDRHAFEERIGPWPQDIRTYAVRLAFGPFTQASTTGRDGQ
ncbi:hypothetical protein ABB55_00650 [Prosthecomicrobium hirschii]|uniref:DUF2239 domain-containing protein n=2 Tax=Prosthecodimorpha hirschii TaxID=665126 RepID=A0A0P6VLB1_9HYPH|nr:DUF2239 family protein [Prosthecomicrobium hirschii]KPL50916.1 hypothetical protein ABB55_00650 [Prosthecomicrobium hirschii]